MVLDKGRIVEFDTPKNLLKNKDSYFYTISKASNIWRKDKDNFYFVYYLFENYKAFPAILQRSLTIGTMLVTAAASVSKITKTAKRKEL